MAFVVPPAAKTVIGIGTFVIAGLMAREASIEGIELFENKVNDRVDKIKNKQSPVPAAVEQ